MAALVYLWFTLPGAHHVNYPSSCHDALETVHLSRGVGDLDASRHVLTAQSSAATIDAAPPGASGPTLVALVSALVAAILAFFPAANTTSVYRRGSLALTQFR